ncbi:MAG: single-stranded DNA-binding protein [Candidatus Woykebacteria bacterium]
MSTRSLNKVMLIGNLTRDPELRYTPSGTAVCSFRLATNRTWTPSDGSEKKEEAEFHRIVSWNKLAELCSQLLTKGRKVYIEGRLQTRSWDTPEGDRRFATEVVAEDMVILDSRRSFEEKGGESQVSEDSGEEPEKVEVEDTGGEAKKEVKSDKKSKNKDSKDSEKKETSEDEGEIDIDDIPF